MGVSMSKVSIITILLQDICTQIAPDLHHSMKQGKTTQQGGRDI
jgi:hypothetical protein